MELESLNIEGKLSPAKEFLINEENDKAIIFLDEVLDKNPSMDNAWLLLGIAKRRIGKFQDAIECFKTVTELNPTIEEVWGLYVVTLLDIGEDSTARVVLDKAYELNPANKKIRFYQENLIHIYKKFGPFF